MKLMAVGSWTIEAKTPRLSRCRVSLANQPSTALAWEHEVEVISKLTRRLTNGLLRAHCPDGGLPGKLRSDWSADASWVCLTGNVQIAHCWLILCVVEDLAGLGPGQSSGHHKARRPGVGLAPDVNVKGKKS
jgi:hypothetical protein